MSKIATAIISFLATVFIVLRVTGQIDWPWLWVLSPLWLPFAAGTIAIIAALAAALIKGLWEAYKRC